MSISLPRPAEGEFNPYYNTYISKVPEGDVVKYLENQLREVRSFLSKVPEGRGDFRYAPDKWSVKEVIGHLCDAERIFAYRALRFARNDQTELPGFDQDPYVPAGKFGRRTMASMIDEFVQVRDATLALVRHFDEETGARGGVASKHRITVRALVWIIAGHMTHHVAVLRDKYGLSA